MGKRFAKAAIGICWVGAFVAGPAARAQTAPAYRVDPYWPKPLPNNWVLGGLGGPVSVYLEDTGHMQAADQVVALERGLAAYAVKAP